MLGLFGTGRRKRVVRTLGASSGMFSPDSVGAQVYGQQRAKMGWDGVLYAGGMGLREYEGSKRFSDSQRGRYNSDRESGMDAAHAYDDAISS